MEKISVIIPVYRVEATLARCVGSVLGQGVEAMEVILVDDGSPDLCPRLCDEWAARDGRVKVVHKPNGGLSDARNAGLAVATGELVTFVDSDDWLESGTYNKVLGEMGAGVDIVEFPVFRFYGSPRQSLLAFDARTYTDCKDYWLVGKAYAHSYACNKIFRRRLFDGVRFPKGKVFEDAWTLPQLLKRARGVRTTGKGLYYYCENAAGITANATGLHLQSLLEAHLSQWDVTDDDEYYLHVLNIQLDVCRQLGVRPVLPRHKARACGHLPLRMRLKALALRLLGVRMLCALYKLGR